MKGVWYDAPSSFNLPIAICKTPRDYVRPVDGPPCPTTGLWYEGPTGACYYVDKFGASYWESVKRCGNALDGSTLTSVTSATENAFVQKLCGENFCWLGAHEHKGRYHISDDNFAEDRSDGSERFAWLDGSPFKFTNWGKGEPNNFKKDENALMMNFDWRLLRKVAIDEEWGHGTWFDVPGILNQPLPLCKMPSQSLDSFDNKRCPADWTEFDNFCYRLLHIPTTRAQAEKRCGSMGGFLVTIRSNVENAFVNSICGKRVCWIGLYKQPGSGAWRWADGQNFTYKNWQLGEPTGVKGEDSAVMHMNLHWSERHHKPANIDEILPELHNSMALAYTIGKTILIWCICLLGIFVAVVCLSSRSHFRHRLLGQVRTNLSIRTPIDNGNTFDREDESLQEAE